MIDRHLRRWPADAVPGARLAPLTDVEPAKLAQFRRRPFALSKREREIMVRLARREGERA